MKILLDTNVVLDHVLNRRQFTKYAGIIFSLIEKGQLQGLLCATTMTTIYYLASKAGDEKSARSITTSLLTLFEIAPVNRVVLENANHSKFNDFEDAVIHEAALNSGAQAIITRDRKGFKEATLSVYTPREVVRILLASDTLQAN